MGLVGVVLEGPQRVGPIDTEIEAELAAVDVTVLPHDVSTATADASLDLAEFLASLEESLPDAAAVALNEFSDFAESLRKETLLISNCYQQRY